MELKNIFWTFSMRSEPLPSIAWARPLLVGEEETCESSCSPVFYFNDTGEREGQREKHVSAMRENGGGGVGEEFKFNNEIAHDVTSRREGGGKQQKSPLVHVVAIVIAAAAEQEST